MFQERNPIINLQRCDRCGKCVALCPENSLTLTDQGPVFNSPSTCTYCTICEDICPQNAIRAPFFVTWESEKQTQ